MNMKQVAVYGRLPTYTDILRRHCDCPFCSYRASTARRGPGANALGAAARVQGQVMKHMREQHPTEVAKGA